MPSFFDKPFEEQIKEIIKGDLILLQMFIGIRNPIGLLQYYASFIITKINIMNARLYGKYKVQEKCLKWYRDGITKEDIEKSVADSKALCIPDNENSTLYNKLVSDCSRDIKKELIANIFFPITNAKSKEYDSISHADYINSSNSDQSLVSYVRNTEVSRLCTIDVKQIIKMYEKYSIESENFIKEILNRYSPGSLKQKQRINKELNVLREKIMKQELEITRYKDSLREIKDRSFLKEWYIELVNRVKNDARKKSDHVLHQNFPKDKTEESVFIGELKSQFILEIVSRLLKEIVGNRWKKEQLNCLKDIMIDQLTDNSKLDYQSFTETVITCIKGKIDEYSDQTKEIFELVLDRIKPDKIMQAEQSILDDILFEAIKQEKTKSALLLICNGANIELEREKIKVKEILKGKLEKPSLLIINELYNDMPSIKACLSVKLDIQVFHEFVVEGHSLPVETNYKVFKIEDIFTLAEIRDSYPDGTIVKEAANCLVECEEDNLALKEQMIEKEKVLHEKQTNFDSKIKGYTNPSWKKCIIVAAPIVITPIVITMVGLPVGSVYYGAQALYYTSTFLLSTIAWLSSCSFYAGFDMGNAWIARRNANNELEIAQKDLDRAIKMFEYFLENLQCSIVAGDDVFIRMCDDIKEEIDNLKKNEKKWVNLSYILSLFENIQKTHNKCESVNKDLSCFNTQSIKFEKLARDIIKNRKRYIFELSQPDQQRKSIGQAIMVINQKETEERKKAELELARIKMKNGEIKQRNEEVEQENGEIKQRSEIYKNLLLQIKNGELPISRLKEIDIDSLIAESSSQTKNEDLPISRLEEVDVKSFIAGPSWQR